MKNDTFSCDICGFTTPLSQKVYVCTPRPSDPTEVVAVLWTCPACAIGSSPLTGTAAQLNEYFDSGEAAKAGYTFLSI